MYQVPTAVWNEVAKQPEMRIQAFKLIMSMTQDEMLEALNQQAEALAQNGVPDSVINAYQTMAPLLAENEAISAYINKTDNSNLRAAMPEVLNAPEAVAIAEQDRPLSEAEQQLLLEMLTPLEPATSINV